MAIVTRSAAILLLFSAVLFAADPTFQLETRSWSPYTPAYLGSGLLGLSTTPLGADPAPSFLAGVYDHAPGDVPRLAIIPAWNALDVNNGVEWLNRATSVTGFRQTLDMYDGVLRTEYQWGQTGRRLRVRLESFVSHAEPTLGVIHLEITPQFSGRLKIRTPLSAWPAPKRYPLEKLEKLEGPAQNQQNIWYPGHMSPRSCAVRHRTGEGSAQLFAKPDGVDTQIAETAAVKWPADLQRAAITGEQSPGACAIDVAFSAAAGTTYVFEKFVSVTRERSDGAAERARARGYHEVLQSSVSAWHELWQEDIQVEGDPNLQTVIHSMLFYLLGSATDRESLSIPPMGLSTAGYYGHVFWDADTFMFPVLLALHPEMAKSLVMFRYRTLDAARRNARQNGRSGAMYPWEAGPDGTEATPRFAFQNALYENHVNADIALEAWQYFTATGDRAWLGRYGYPIIRDTADFWTSRVTFNKDKDRYEIRGVVSVDESKIGVTDDPYTNAAAKKNLEIAIQSARLLGQPGNDKWREIANKLYLPRRDLVPIDYPLEFPLTQTEKRAILANILRESTGRQSGVMMEVEFRPIPAVELGEHSVLQKLLDDTYRPYVRAPFNVVPETPTNDNINFLTGAGAFLHQFIFGYAGLRFSEEDGLRRKFAPLLPQGITRLVLRNLSVHGRRVTVSIPGAH